jgi:hypothetical protein
MDRPEDQNEDKAKWRKALIGCLVSAAFLVIVLTIVENNIIQIVCLFTLGLILAIGVPLCITKSRILFR